MSTPQEQLVQGRAPVIGSGLEMGLGQAEEVQHQTFIETVMGKDLAFQWTAKLATFDPGGGHLCSLGNSLPANEANNKRMIKLETEGVRGLERERERNKKWSLASGRSKANKEARLVERKICFISEASNLVCVCVSCPKANSPPLTIGGQELLYRPREEAICRKNTFSSDGHLEISYVVG